MSRARPWTDQDIERLKISLEAGMTDDEIAYQERRTVAAVRGMREAIEKEQSR